MARTITFTLTEEEYQAIQSLIPIFFKEGVLKRPTVGSFCKFCVIHTLLEIKRAMDSLGVGNEGGKDTGDT